DGLIKAEPLAGQPGIGHDPQECANGLPRQSYRRRLRKHILHPGAGFCMFRGRTVVRVKKNVRVENNHRRAGPSSASNNCSTLSQASPGGRPSFRGVTTNAFRGGRVAAISPRRKKRFTTSLNEAPERRLSFSSSRVTSSSSESVVRTS